MNLYSIYSSSCCLNLYSIYSSSWYLNLYSIYSSSWYLNLYSIYRYAVDQYMKSDESMLLGHSSFVLDTVSVFVVSFNFNLSLSFRVYYNTLTTIFLLPPATETKRLEYLIIQILTTSILIVLDIKSMSLYYYYCCSLSLVSPLILMFFYSFVSRLCSCPAYPHLLLSGSGVSDTLCLI